jgi:hypothetical protein
MAERTCCDITRFPNNGHPLRSQPEPDPVSESASPLIYNAHGHKLCFPTFEKAKFVTALGITQDAILRYKDKGPMPLKRPFGVTLLLWMVLIQSAWGAVRFFAALRWWDILVELDAALSPVYLSITGAGWVVAGGVILSGMLLGKTWVRPAVITSILLWLIEYWIERIFFQPPRANLTFALTGSVIILAVAIAATFQRSTKHFLIRSEEHEQPDKNPSPE